MKWININDSLPEESMACLIRTTKNDTEIAWYMRDDKCVRHFFQPRQGIKRCYSIDEQITHWMPLPEPPND